MWLIFTFIIWLIKSYQLVRIFLLKVNMHLMQVMPEHAHSDDRMIQCAWLSFIVFCLFFQ